MQSANVNAFSIDPPIATADNLRDYLAHDNLFTEYLNMFIALPTGILILVAAITTFQLFWTPAFFRWLVSSSKIIFPVPYYYCNTDGLFRVMGGSEVQCPKSNEAPSPLSKRLPSISAKRHSFQSIPLLPMEDNSKASSSSKDGRHISNLVLNKRKGLQWIQKERLSLFLQSQLYAEYRLARILSQARLMRQDKTSIPDLYLNIVPLVAPPPAINSPIHEDISESTSETKIESVLLLFGDTSQTDIESWQKASQESDINPANQLKSPRSDSLGDQIDNCVLFANMDAIEPEIGPPAYVEANSKKADVPTLMLTGPKKSENFSHGNNLQELSSMLIATVVKNAIVEVENVSSSAVEASLTYQKLFPFKHGRTNFLPMDMFTKTACFDKPIDKTTGREVLPDVLEYEDITSSSEESSITLTIDDQKEPFLENGVDEEQFVYFSTYASVVEFRALLKETSSEKNWFLWIDLEKFRLSQTDAGKEISILAIKNRYYNTRTQFELPVNLKNDIDIANWKSLINDQVLKTQRKILEPFFKYWVPLYLLKKQIQANPSKYASYFMLKKINQRTSENVIPEMDPQDVSIFVLKSSFSEQKKTPAMSTKVKPLDTFALPPIEPLIGMRRTYLISTLQHQSVAKHYNWRKMQNKRGSVPTVKTTANDKITSSFIFREVQDPIKPFTSARSTPPFPNNTLWPNCPIKIELVDNISEAGRTALPKELSCMMILKCNEGSCCEETESSVHNDLEEDTERMHTYKLLSSLFSALRCERASGDIFALYLRERNLKKSTNCLMLWDSISKFLCLFYDQPMAWSKIIRQVKIIYSEYLSASPRLNVECNQNIVENIKQQMNNPTGDMFKYAAEHVLAILLPSWKQYLMEEKCKSIELLNS